MNYFTCTIIIIVSISISAVSTDSCPEAQCKCSQDLTVVNCDSKPSLNLSNIEFPSEVVTLTLINDRLKFDTSADRSKIANLSRLQDLSLNHNPLTIIPSFNISSLRSLSLQDTSLTSVEFPPSYSSSILQTVILSDNKIRSIASTDFAVLKNTKTKRLHIDSASLTTIDQNAFTPLSQLQSLSLNKNQLKSCDFLSTLRVLSSIKLDGNIFTSLPQQLSTPNDIKIFSFKNNNISIIDESSSLFVWQKKNWTNMRVYLEKNPFDCCQSLWFVRFLKISPNLVADALSLTCVTPSSYAGKKLIDLDPNSMNCGGVQPEKSWWTTQRIITVSGGGSFVVLVAIGFIVIWIRQRPSRTGYTEIEGVNESFLNAPPPSSPSELPFPPHGEDETDDAVSSYSTAPTRYTNASEARTFSTVVGVSVHDDKCV